MDTITLSHHDLQKLAAWIARTPVVIGDAEKITWGENVSFVNALFNVSSGTISVGDNTFFGHNVCLLAAGHPTNGNRQDWLKEGYDIVIGKNVWVASNVTILGPCTIGDNAIIGAGAVVTKDLEGDWVYAGVPARKLKPI